MKIQAIKATIEAPIRGVWVADLVSIDEPQSGTLEIFGAEFVGTVVSKSEYGGLWHSRFVGGNHSLKKSPGFRQYRGRVEVSTIVNDIIRFSGETPGTISIDQTVESFERSDQSAGVSLDILGDLFGCIWWISFDGKTNFGPSRSGKTIKDPILLDVNETGATVVLSSFSDLNPGDLIENRKIEHVRYLLEANKLVAEISFNLPLDKPDRSWYGRIYRAQVERQHLDYSVDLIVDSKFQLSRVPLHAPAKTILKEGDLVNVGFYRADPRLPFAIPSETSKVIDIGTFQYTPGSPTTTGQLIWIPPASPDNPAPAPVTLTPAGSSLYGVIK